MDVLSVIVPIHNDERGIRAACLDIATAARPLVWEGTIDDYEIVLVDDGSTDGTGESADVFAKRDKNVVVVHHNEPLGFDASIATGVATARGSLIAHGEAQVPFAAGALRPALEKLRAEDLHSVGVHPDGKLIAKVLPGRARAALTLSQSGSVGHGERDLPRSAARMRLEPDVPLLPKRARIGLASLAALSLAVVLVGVTVLSNNKSPTNEAAGSFVGRHDHLALAPEQPPARADGVAATQPTTSARAIVTPATPAPQRASAAPTITAVGIDSTCKTDATRALQTLVDGAPDDATIALQPKGCYLASGGLSLTKRRQVTLDGRMATLRTGALTCTSSTQIGISDLTVEGPDGSPAIVLNHCSSIALSNVKLNGDDVGLRITAGSTDVGVSGLTADTYRAAVEVADAQRIALDKLSLRASNAPAVLLDPPAGSLVKDVELRDSTLSSPLADVTSTGDGAVNDVWIHDDQLNGGRTKIYVRSDPNAPSQTWRIYRNTGDVVQSLGSYVSFSYVNDILIAYNKLHANVVPLRAAVRFASAQGDVAVTNNDFTGACHTYSADSRTSSVRSENNTTSNC